MNINLRTLVLQQIKACEVAVTKRDAETLRAGISFLYGVHVMKVDSSNESAAAYSEMTKLPDRRTEELINIFNVLKNRLLQGISR